MRYHSTDWSIDVPDGWTFEKNTACTSFYHPDGVGAFQVSSYRKDAPVTDLDLREFADDIPLVAFSCGTLAGFRTRFSEDDTFWTKWWLRAGQQMILVTYNCPLSEHGSEDDQISSMIQSLTPEL
jgi:hypothetical protein